MQIYAGWYVVAAAFILAVFGWGLGFYGPPIYLQAVLDRTALSMATVSGAVTFHFVAGAAMVLCLPFLYRRLSVAVVTCLGCMILAAGLFGWARADSIPTLYLAAAGTGLGWVTMGAAALNAIVSPWFETRRPLALAMAYNGASLGGVIFSPFWALLIASIGFADAVSAVTALLILTTFALSSTILKRRPTSAVQSETQSEKPQMPGRSTANEGGRRAFLTLSVGMALGLFAQVGLIAHLFSVLHARIGQEQAGWALSLATVCAVAGRSLCGWLMPNGANRRTVAAASYAVQILGCLCLAAGIPGDVALVWAGIVLFGLGIGNATSLPPLIAQAEFPGGTVTSVVARIVAAAQFTYAFAPAAFGAMRQAWDGPNATPAVAILLLAAAVKLLAAAVFLLGKGPTTKPRPPAPETRKSPRRPSPW